MYVTHILTNKLFYRPCCHFVKESLKSLDWRRLGKQRVEAKQILNVLLERTDTKGWRNHPITRMWAGYESALQLYFNLCVKEWVGRGYNNNMELRLLNLPITWQLIRCVK